MDLEVIRGILYDWALVIGAIIVAVIKIPEFLKVVSKGYAKAKRWLLKDIYEKVHSNKQRLDALEESRDAARQTRQTNEG